MQEESIPVSLTVDHIGPAYPNELPLIRIQSRVLSNQMVRSITIHVAKKSQELVGIPMVHELLMSACEFLASVPDGAPPGNEKTFRIDDYASSRAKNVETVDMSAQESENRAHESRAGKKKYSRGKIVHNCRSSFEL